MDELPQLLNVLTGSITGRPRPPLSEEVLVYSREEHRRLQCGPGSRDVTGQRAQQPVVAESIRLDPRYTAKWSVALDALILWKTVGAVITGETTTHVTLPALPATRHA